MSEVSDTYNRQQKKGTQNNEQVEVEVQKLLKKVQKNSDISTTELNKLRSKFNDSDLVNKIQDAFVDKHEAILKRAKKFAKLVRDKYASKNYPLHILLQKAHKYKVKYNLTDDEYNIFYRICIKTNQ